MRRESREVSNVCRCSLGGPVHASQSVRGEQDANRRQSGDRQDQAGRDHVKVSAGGGRERFVIKVVCAG
jgi:hypothetical protein